MGAGRGARAAASPSTEAAAGTDDTPGLKPNGESEPLAETGGSDPTLPIGIAAAVLAIGGGLLFAARRKRS
ncbi:LAETG motif-containing sortase-dependent surface protein [Streptomyces sp. rh34]|uniref:LAETG motif-containing sortase-dependent surface protein n=1 Tax=Streptomyces sp. rh34 TaxID=2034272 RepID=UPI00211D55AE|nr:LAETG motif-containing sortase-dependent surface protein [Streptomyces sp. rh34]